MKKDWFISILIEKLNILKRDQEVRERLEKSLQEFKTIRASAQSNITKAQPIPPKAQTSDVTRRQRVKHESPRNPNSKHPTLPTNERTKRREQKVPSNTSAPNNGFTIIGYCFAGNTVPYSIKVRTKKVTLGHFKTLVNRKGYFRYFFKRYCNEFGTNIVFEEITDNEEMIPLWDGKIFALIEEIEEYLL